MNRLTKKISDKQTYCGYEVKDCKYQQIYDFKKYSELEDYVDCDLTLAIDKLGQLEDLEEELGCPLEKLLTTNEIYSDLEDGTIKKYKIIGINFCEKKIYFWMSFVPMNVDFTDYKKVYWLKENKSE